MADLIDRTAALERFRAENYERSMIAIVREAPAVDAVVVVRCKDCKHYKEFRTKRNKQIMRFCLRMAKYEMSYHVKPDDFCSYGERKENE